jgi:hypothetical protein
MSIKYFKEDVTLEFSNIFNAKGDSFDKEGNSFFSSAPFGPSLNGYFIVVYPAGLDAAKGKFVSIFIRPTPIGKERKVRSRKQVWVRVEIRTPDGSKILESEQGVYDFEEGVSQGWLDFISIKDAKAALSPSGCFCIQVSVAKHKPVSLASPATISLTGAPEVSRSPKAPRQLQVRDFASDLNEDQQSTAPAAAVDLGQLLYADMSLADVSLVTKSDVVDSLGTEELKAHRAVLVVVSDYFRNLLKPGSDEESIQQEFWEPEAQLERPDRKRKLENGHAVVETTCKQINLSDFNRLVVQRMLEFIYVGSIATIPHMAIDSRLELLRLADFVRFPELSSYIINFIANDDLTIENVFLILDVAANTLGNEVLKTKCLEFWKNNRSEIANHKKFQETVKKWKNTDLMVELLGIMMSL